MADLDDGGPNKLVTEKGLEPGFDVDVTNAGVAKIGFFGVDPVVRVDAYTQTYSTAARTVPAATFTTLTLADGAGTNDGAIGAITNNASYIAAFQEVVAGANANAADILAIKKVLNSLIDDLQAYGLVQ